MAGYDDSLDLRMIVVCLRALHKWTQEEFSRRSGVDRGLISDYELGKKMPTRRTLDRLAGAAGLTYGDLESLLPLFRILRYSAERGLAEGTRQQAEREGFAGNDLAQEVGDSVRATLTPFLMELTALLDDEDEDSED